MRRLPELLAPAGSPEALRAAVAAGADAVYLSGKRFGARRFAANFDLEELEAAVAYAHLRRVRVYVTVNTLVREDELAEVADYLLRLYEMGADAVLVQDAGVAAMARRLVPDLDLHASTQMTIHNSEGVAWAARAGFKRAVLAREVSLDEIGKMLAGMKNGTEYGKKEGGPEIGLEVFVHGALCYSYSGQCLLSSAIGGRSGNRGMCAQPCRKPYALLQGERDEYGRPRGLRAIPCKERFLISTRDLCVYRHLDRVVRSPVVSLKIEGRMKSPEYVAVVTSIYRRALDTIACGHWAAAPEDERDLALAFNRDFTEGHLLGAKDVMGRQMSDNRGVFVGSVASFDSRRGEAAVRLCGPLSPVQGDGLVIFAPGQETGMVVQRATIQDGRLILKTPERVRPGAKVYLTSSASLDRRAQEIAARSKAPIPVDLSISWEDGRPVAAAQLEEGISIQVRADFGMEKARSQPTTAGQIEAQLRRTGGTPFVIRRVEMDYPGDLFAPLGSLNRWRREILARAGEALLSARRPPAEEVAAARERRKEMDLTAAPPAPAPSRRVPSLAVYADSLETVRGAVDGGCRRIYFEPLFRLVGEADRTARAAKFIELLSEAKAICADAELIWKWPKITRDDFLEMAGPLAQKAKADGIMVEGAGAAVAARAATSARLYGACGLNVWNHLAICQFSSTFQLLTLSPELSGDQLAEAAAWAHQDGAAPQLELVVQGSLEVMVAEDCLPLIRGVASPEGFWGLQDWRRVFPLRLDDEGRTHIFNSVETCLLDYMPRLFEIGLDSLAVDARGRTGRYAREMTEIYMRAIELTGKGSSSLQSDLMDLKERIGPLVLGGITSGHFIKGLKEEIS